MSDLFGNHIVGFPTRRLISVCGASGGVLHPTQQLGHMEFISLTPIRKTGELEALEQKFSCNFYFVNFLFPKLFVMS